MATNTTVSLPKGGFKPPRLSPTPWPVSPLLELPAGALFNCECGKALAADGFVLAVRLSPKLYLAVARAPGVGPVGTVLEQAVGFLHAHGAVVVRTNLRAPMGWFADDQGDFSWRKCLVFFSRIYLSTDPTDPPWVPPMIWPVIRVATVASAGLEHWQTVNKVLEGIEAADSSLLSLLGGSLRAMARRWEFYMGRMIVLSQRAGEYGADDQELAALCDRLLLSIMKKFEPGYELLSATTLRLL
jgi:hypothetical protein